MKDFLLATPTDVLAGAFGVTTALLLVGGSIALRLQRQSQRFALLRAAIDKGITRLPGGAPFWLVSMRQGVVAVALGFGLLLVGGIGARMASRVPPPAASTQPVRQREARPDYPPRPMDDEGPPDRPFNDAPPGPNHQRANGPRDDFQGEPPPPPRPDLPTQRWHFAQMELAVGLGAIGCGIVLLLVGIARILFATVEKRHEKSLGDEVI